MPHYAVRIVISITPKPTPFVPALQAAAPGDGHILRHTGTGNRVAAAFRHTTSMTAKYNPAAQPAATHRADVRVRVAGDNYACRGNNPVTPLQT
ncbi:exported hypothetical protein [Arthrobacter sp. 9AX]|nr:exported hypothetical protein [Arthrobacter sp. 9AX]